MNANIKLVNLEVISALANRNQDDLSQYDQLVSSGSTELADAVADLVKQERSDAIKAAAKEIQSLLSATASIMASEVQSIRSARQAAKMGLSKLKHIERARTYGLETNNFMPLVTATSGVGNSYVPENWVSKVELAETTAPKAEASAKPRVTVAKRK